MYASLSLCLSLRHSRIEMTPNGIEWRACTHAQPHVISLYGAAVGTEDLMLVMEYAQNGTSLSPHQIKIDALDQIDDRSEWMNMDGDQAACKIGRAHV